MSTIIKSIRIPVALSDCLAKRAAMLHYGSVNSYLTGLLRQDLVLGRPHSSANMAKCSSSLQQIIDEDIREMFRAGIAANPSWFKNRLVELGTSDIRRRILTKKSNSSKGKKLHTRHKKSHSPNRRRTVPEAFDPVI